MAAFLVAMASAGFASAATVSFRAPAKGERWPSVELRREAKDPAGALEARVTLRQVTNPRQVFGPYLFAKDVGVVALAPKQSSTRQSLDRVVSVPASSLVPGRYELRVRVLTAARAVVGEGATLLDEARVDALAGRRTVPTSGFAVAAESRESSAEPLSADPKLAVLDASELASLPSREARMTAQTFAYVLATRDAGAFRQLVAERGLRTDRGTVPHAELERQTQGGLDALVGPAPRAPWHVEFRRDTPDRFTMKPRAKAAESVTFEKSADGRWRIGEVSRKRAPSDDD